MINRIIGTPNRYGQALARISIYAVVFFVAFNMVRAFTNCGPWAREDTKKSCVINQPRRPIVIGEAEEIKPLRLVKTENKKSIVDLINIRTADGTLTVNPVVREGPGNQFSIVARIRTGDVVEIIETEEKDWIKLRILEPNIDEWIGWVRGHFQEDQSKPGSESKEDVID